jgi:hypothetical protein
VGEPLAMQQQSHLLGPKVRPCMKDWFNRFARFFAYIFFSFPAASVTECTPNCLAKIPYSCNTDQCFSNLASQPLKQAVAAVAEHLAGLVPTQVTYSHAHQNSAQVCEYAAFSFLFWIL